MEPRKKIGFFLGPLLFLAAYSIPAPGLNQAAHRLLALFLLVVVWWVTECIPIPVTALLIPVGLSVLGIATATNALAPFANPIIMLFLGSFILAKAMGVHGIDRKIATSVLSFKAVSKSPLRILIAMGAISLFLSMWISNTATTAMMYPIALGLMDAFDPKTDKSIRSAFGIALLLTLAYSASIGGIGTPIGSPPNLIALGMLEKLTDIRIDFFRWMVAGLLILIPMYMGLLFFMRRHLHSRGLSGLSIRSDWLKTTKTGLTGAQKNVFAAFSVTVFLWVFPGIVSLIAGRNAPLYLWFRNHIPEATAALIGASLLFFLPVDLRKGRFTLTLKDALDVDWGTLLLFGGGLSLGYQMFETGLADSIGKFFISMGGESPSLAVVTLLAVTFSVFVTELTSNTASANMIIPIVIAISHAAGISPLPPVMGSAIGCSFAFMLPVATPPNAIVYGSRMIPLPQMMRFGFRLNLTGIVIIWIITAFLLPLILGGL